MPRSRIALVSWIAALAFVLGTALVFVDRLNLVATPPQLPEDTNLVDRMIGIADYRQAIWPVFFWTNLLFAIGFVASVAFATLVASAWGGLTTFKTLVTVGGIIAAIASMIPIAAVNASVWQLYCDCGFKETEVVAGVWAMQVAEDLGFWLNRFGSIILAIGLLAFVLDARARLSPTLRTWTWLLVIALVAWPLLAITEVTGDPTIEEWVTIIAGAILLPVWAIWVGRAVDGAPGDPVAASA
jgi:hypothetical protein